MDRLTQWCNSLIEVIILYKENKIPGTSQSRLNSADEIRRKSPEELSSELMGMIHASTAANDTRYQMLVYILHQILDIKMFIELPSEISKQQAEALTNKISQFIAHAQHLSTTYNNVIIPLSYMHNEQSIQISPYGFLSSVFFTWNPLSVYATTLQSTLLEKFGLNFKSNPTIVKDQVESIVELHRLTKLEQLNRLRREDESVITRQPLQTDLPPSHADQRRIRRQRRRGEQQGIDLFGLFRDAINTASEHFPTDYLKPQ